jgi:ubiquinone/menaquinone biosynthesis C-methylase UbiE
MDDWIDYYDSTHTIYVSKLHRDLHFQIIARDIIGYITSKEATVLDYACGEALSAGQVAAACGKLILAEPAPGVRGRLIARFAPNTKIRVRSLDDVRKMKDQSIDLVVMNSVAQYMTPEEFDAALINIRRSAPRCQTTVICARASGCSATARMKSSRSSKRPASQPSARTPISATIAGG